jgi:hypothetical protein
MFFRPALFALVSALVVVSSSSVFAADGGGNPPDGGGLGVIDAGAIDVSAPLDGAAAADAAVVKDGLGGCRCAPVAADLPLLADAPWVPDVVLSADAQWRWIPRSHPIRVQLLILSWQLTWRRRVTAGPRPAMEAPVMAVRGRRQCICPMAETRDGSRMIRDAASGVAVREGARR